MTILLAVAGAKGVREVGQGGSGRLPASLDPLIHSYSSPVDKALKALKQGVESYLKGEYTACLQALSDDTIANTTVLGDYVFLYRAKANLMLDRGDEALKLFRLFEARYPESPLYTDGVVGEFQAYIKLHDSRAALAVLQNLKLPETADMLYYRARAVEESGERQKSEDLYLRVYCDFVNSDSATLAHDRLLALSPGALTGARNFRSLLDRADNLLRAGRTREAQTLLLRLAREKAPDKASMEKRILLSADADYRLRRTSTALANAKKIGPSDPLLHARALYLEGACYRSLKQEETLLEVREKATELYPASQYTEQLLTTIAAYFDSSNEVRRAHDAYLALLEHFPKGDNSGLALWRASLFSYVQKQYGEALKGFYDYLRAHPEPRYAIPAIYWMGRCYESLGDIGHAATLMEHIKELAHDNYYSGLALEDEKALKKAGPARDRPYAGLDFNKVAEDVHGVRISFATVDPPSDASARIIERARQLAAADLTSLALSELRQGVRLHPGERALNYATARIYERGNDYYGVTTILRRAFPDYSDRPMGSLPPEIWELLFPVKHWSVIIRQATKYGLDPNLVLGMIRQESSFEEAARSPANARGLMQVLPSTGRIIAPGAGVTRYTVKKLYVAETNIMLGTHYLASLLRRYGNNEVLALAAYDAGDTRADRWINEFGTADMALFVERIPFSETRGYIEQILTNKAHYGRLTAYADTIR